MNKIDDMAYMRGRDDARCELPRFPQSFHPDNYGAYNAGYRDYGNLKLVPAMVETLRLCLEQFEQMESMFRQDFEFMAAIEDVRNILDQLEAVKQS